MTTAREIESILGEIEPIYLERILETGAALEEVSEALVNLEYEQRTGVRREPSSPGVAAVRAILEDMFEGEDLDDERESSRSA